MTASKSESDPALGALIRRVRQEQGLSREDVTYRAGVAVSTLLRIEVAQGEPGWMNVRRVARALGLGLADIGAVVERDRPRG